MIGDSSLSVPAYVVAADTKKGDYTTNPSLTLTIIPKSYLQCNEFPHLRFVSGNKLHMLRHLISLAEMIVTGSTGTSPFIPTFWVFTFSIASTIAMPSTTLPKTA